MSRYLVRPSCFVAAALVAYVVCGDIVEALRLKYIARPNHRTEIIGTMTEPKGFFSHSLTIEG